MNSWSCCFNANRADLRSLYLHVPFCDGKCPYCAFYSVPYSEDQAEAYLQALAKEASFYKGIQPRTIYVGGGTPSLFSLKLLHCFLAVIRNLIGNFVPDEWTFEVNPGAIAHGVLPALAEAGVNRLSIGAQAFDDNILQRLGRRHTVADILATYSKARAAGFQNIGLDLIAAVPGVSAQAWLHTLKCAARLAPEHISVYALTAEEGTLLTKRVRAGLERLSDEDTELYFLHSAERIFRRCGFKRYEISNYAQPGFECIHNLSCWRGENYLGLGPAASSRIGLQRQTNLPDLQAWLHALANGLPPPAENDPLTPELDRIERLIFGLRTAEGVPAALATGSEKILAQLRRERLVRLIRGRWHLTAAGRDLADYVAVELMP